ncbi:vancomycin resistance protein YoaR [Bacillus niacini]|uniref:Vancomycin resistance protein YoaR n=1 Tax=Neobacillus niacini TaxID=86668 RepID=A0A852T9G4_9BACI|nr:VanW family protein [Neobacillus niacini]NYE04128.1 vancomycin resistance protein YoaR [Neobacillus niacini]
MSIRTWAISFILVGSLIGLAGCAEKTNGKEADLEHKVTELEKKLEEQKAAEEAARKAEEEAEAKRKAEEEAKKPKVVNVVDPTTKNIIKSLIPVDMGFGTDNEKYKQELENWAKDLARGTDTTPGYDTKMMLDKIDANGQVIKGKPRVILEEVELVDKIIEASVKGGDVILPIYVTESGYKPEDAAHLSEVVVATYTTKFNPSITGRNKNIELSAQAIDNVIVGTGDIFSFNYTVGPSDEAHGYQPAQEIVNKELVMGIGGGICQTSSTLFNAVDQLAVDYVEWHHHSLTVGYVPEGRDATVSYGGKDFQFKNTAGVPLLIKAIYNPNGTFTVEMRTSAAYQALLQKR